MRSCEVQGSFAARSTSRDRSPSAVALPVLHSEIAKSQGKPRLEIKYALYASKYTANDRVRRALHNAEPTRGETLNEEADMFFFQSNTLNKKVGTCTGDLAIVVFFNLKLGLGVGDERDTLGDVLGEVGEGGVEEDLLGGGEGTDGVDLLNTVGLWEVETLGEG